MPFQSLSHVNCTNRGQSDYRGKRQVGPHLNFPKGDSNPIPGLITGKSNYFHIVNPFNYPIGI